MTRTPAIRERWTGKAGTEAEGVTALVFATVHAPDAPAVLYYAERSDAPTLHGKVSTSRFLALFDPPSDSTIGFLAAGTYHEAVVPSGGRSVVITFDEPVPWPGGWARTSFRDGKVSIEPYEWPEVAS